MAIALLYYTKRGITSKNQIFIFRQLSKLPAKTSSSCSVIDATAAATSIKKRKLFDSDEEKDYYNDTDYGQGRSENISIKKKKEKCWVDMQQLYTVISQIMRQSTQRDESAALINAITQAPFSDADFVGAAVWLMLCAGTDFSRSLPLIGPKRLWDHLPMIAPALVQGFAWASAQNTSQNHLLCNEVVGKLYRLMFSKHIKVATTTAITTSRFFKRKENDNGDSIVSTIIQKKTPNLLKEVLEKLRQQAAGSTRNKKGGGSGSSRMTRLLPSEAQILTTFKNVAWVMQYWTEYNACIQAPLDGSHGFVHCAGTSCGVIFEDLQP